MAVPEAHLFAREQERARVGGPFAQPPDTNRDGGPVGRTASADDGQAVSVGQGTGGVWWLGTVPAQAGRPLDPGQLGAQLVDHADRVVAQDRLAAVA